MLPKTSPQHPRGRVAPPCTADLFARNDPKLWFRPCGHRLPVGDEAAEREPLALLPDARKIAALLNARGAAQAFRRFGRHCAKSNRRQAFAAHAAAVGQRGLAALAGITVQKPVLALATDFRRLILAFHKIKICSPRWRGNSV